MVFVSFVIGCEEVRDAGKMKKVYVVSIIFLFLIIGLRTINAALSDGILYYYDGGSVTEQVSGIYDLTEIGSPNYNNGKVGNGYNVSEGTNNFQAASIPLPIDNDFSINVWFRGSNFDHQYNGILGRSDDPSTYPNPYEFFYENNAKTLVWNYGNGGSLDSISVSSGQPNNFVMVTLTRNSTEFLMWINGTIQGSDSSVQAIVDDVSDLFGIGEVQISWGSNYWNGVIDEVGFWNKTLNQVEIEELWNGGNGITYSDFTGGTPSITV